MDVLVVIPARMESTRFPGKPLADLCGKPMVQWVYEAASRSGTGARVVVATPNPEIAEACAGFRAEAVITSSSHETGTDRLAEVASSIEADVYLNVQGDEPLIDPLTIAACAGTLLGDPDAQVGSVYCECPASEVDDPAVVKVVTDRAGFALYFSRHGIPYDRGPREGVKKHIGLYAFRKPALEAFAGWPRTPLEVSESLEQLRFLENGVRIRMAAGKGTELAVDTPEQADQVRRILTSRAESRAAGSF